MRIIYAGAVAYARGTYRDLIRAVRTDTMGSGVGTIDGSDTDVDDSGATIDLLAAFLETETGDHDYRL